MKKRKAFKWIIYKVDQQLGMTVRGGPGQRYQRARAATRGSGARKHPSGSAYSVPRPPSVLTRTLARRCARPKVIDTAGGPDSSHEDFLAALPDDQPRFAVLDKVYINKDECRFDKIVFALYNPDSARIKQKMLYASSKDAFKGTFQGVSLEMQATDTTELDDESVMLRVRDVITRK